MFPDGPARARAVGAWSGVTALAVALGPLAGGFISQHWHWGWIFYINLPLGGAALAAGAAAVSEAREPGTPPPPAPPRPVAATPAPSALTSARIPRQP